MAELSIAAAGTSVLRTVPFFVLRAAVYLGVAAAFAVAANGGAGIGLGLGTLAGQSGRAPGAFWGAIGGVAAVTVLIRWLREYFLYFVEIPHACALQSGGALKKTSPQGRIGAGMTSLQRRFSDVRSLADADRRVRETLADLCADLEPFRHFLPATVVMPRFISERLLPGMFGFAAKCVLARAVRGPSRNAYTDLRDSLILLAQNNETLLRNAILLAAISFGSTVVAFFLALVPAFSLTQSIASGGGLVAVLLAAVFAACFRQAAVEPLLAASFNDGYARTIGAQEPEPAWDERLVDISPSYREIKALAAPSIRTRRGFIA